MICTRSAGFDHIDLMECKKRKIAVYNVPCYGENTVAEYTLGLILMASRKLLAASERAKSGNFNFEGLIGFDLKDKTLGVIGTGKIGKHVIRMAKGFEMNILAFDKFKSSKEAKYVSLNELLAKSDIITLHAPYCKETHHLINRKNLKQIKKGAVLINTSRGGLVETESLVEGLNKNIFSFVAIDVIEGEPLIKEEKELLSKHFDKKTIEILLENHILMEDPRVIITPHTAFYSKEALERINDTTFKNIELFLKNKSENRII
jgi:D-lactate dehydrogenase